MSKRSFAEIMLIITAIIWALTYPFIRAVVAEMNPVVLIFWRGGVAAILFAILLIPQKNQYSLFKLLPAGFFLGLMFYISYVTQAVGMETIESGRSAFITSLYVIFVPMLSPFFRSTPPTKNDVISCFIAFCGLALLTDPISQKGLKIGDLWTILSALAFSIQIHLLQLYTRKYQSYGSFAFLQAFFIALFAMISIPLVGNPYTLLWFPTTKLGIYSFLYLVLFATAATTWLQARYQHDTTAERASVIYVLEPVFALVFGYVILHEVISFISFVGAVLMVLSVLWGFIIRAISHSRSDMK